MNLQIDKQSGNDHDAQKELSPPLQIKHKRNVSKSEAMDDKGIETFTDTHTGGRKEGTRVGTCPAKKLFLLLHVSSSC